MSEEGGDVEGTVSETSSLCTYVREEGDDGETVRSETPSLLCTCVSEEGGDREAACSENLLRNAISVYILLK